MGLTQKQTGKGRVHIRHTSTDPRHDTHTNTTDTNRTNNKRDMKRANEDAEMPPPLPDIAGFTAKVSV